MCSRILYNLNPPGCGALFLRRATAGACKKRAATRAVYLANGNPEQRSDFCKRPPRRAAKTG